MAPLRRYLRITKYSVLECRIYLDNPALAHSWLLNPRDPVLPRVIEAIRPFVLPKLREERERARKKSTKKRGIKDTVAQDDFEVSIFLTETSTRHSLLYKHKHFRDTAQTKLTSNSTKLTGYSKDAPIDLEKQNDLATAAPFEAQDGTTPVRFLREEDDDDEVVPLHEIPSVDRDDTNAAAEPAPPPAMRPSKRRREPSGSSLRYNRDGAELDDSARNTAQGAGPRRGAANNMVVEDSDDDDLFVTDNDESDAEARYSAGLPVEIDDEDTTTLVPPAKRRKNTALAAETVPEEALRDDKKKLAMDISYEGFSIYGRVLCLVIKRRDGFAGGKGKGKAVATTSATGSTASTTVRGGRGGQSAAPGGQAVMENWITSTQMPADTIAE